MKRRDFIKALPLGVAAASIPFSIPGFRGEAFGKSPLLNAILNGSDGSDRILVLINLQGGNDGLNCVIPFEDPLYKTNRPVLGFNASDLSSAPKMRTDLAMNPLMNYKWTQGRESKLGNLFSDGKLAVIQNVGYTNPNRSHFRATDIWNSASDSEVIVSTGWVGRYLETARPQYPFDVAANEDPLAMSIGFSTSLAFQGGKSIMGVAVTDPSKYNAATLYADDVPPNNNYGHELGFVRNILTQSDVYGKRFKDLFPTVPTNNVAYPAANPLAQQLKKVAWCIAKGMKTKVYFVSQGGYDTHINQYSKDPSQGQGKLLFELAEAISIFQADIEAMGTGVSDRVLGMTYSEFGRRVNENGSAGTDHGTSAPQFLFGTQVNGEVYGNHPNLSNLDIYADLKNQFDFRQLYAGVLTDWFGTNDAMRKAILNKPEFSKQNDFSFLFPVNDQAKQQSLIKTPATISVRSSYVEDKIFILQQNYPNPVVTETTIRFDLSETARVTLEVFDSRGELVATPVQSTLGRGEHPINFNANRLAAGTYFYRLDVNGSVETKAMKVVR